MKRANDGDIAIKPRRQYVKKEYQASRAYGSPGIPYEVSRPNPDQFWSIKKWANTPQYWQKRYWRRRITGRGTYRMDPEQSFGRRWGGYLGSKLGEFAGGAAHAAFTGLTGLGDYKVRRNVFMTGNLPKVTNISESGGNTIRFQEYLCDIITSGTPGALDIQSWMINPANPDTFPFLSQVAMNYEQYVIEGMLFAFQSRSADALNSTNTALGSVMFATQYDVMDAPFQSKADMLNYEFSTSCKPSENCMHMIECEPRQTTINELYTISSNSVPTGADPRLYFLGKLSVGTIGFQAAAVNIGELRVTYQVRLLKPKLYVTLAQNYEYYFAQSITTWSNANPLPTTLVGGGATNISVVYNAAARTLTLPASNNAVIVYRVMMQWTGSTPQTWTPPAITLSGASIGNNISTPAIASSASVVCMDFGITTDGSNSNPIITIGNAGSLPTTPANFLLRITRQNPGLTALR